MNLNYISSMDRIVERLELHEKLRVHKRFLISERHTFNEANATREINRVDRVEIRLYKRLERDYEQHRTRQANAS